MRLLLILVGIFLSVDVRAAVYFAATNGTAGGTGAIGSPWDLRTALKKTATLVGGDYLEMRGGAYTNAPEGSIPGITEGHIFQATISGAYGNPITIESATNEWAMIDGQAFGGAAYEFHASTRPTLMVGEVFSTKGWFLRWRNFEIMSSSTEPRFSTNDLSIPDGQISRPDGGYFFGKSNLVINVISHDLNTGFSIWEGASDTSLYGCLAYNNGWIGTPHLHGHGMYTQNALSSGPRIISNCIIPNNSANAIQAYGSSTAEVYHYKIINDIIYNNRLLLGGKVNAFQGDNLISSNLLYNSDLVFIYLTSTNSSDIVVANNYLGRGGMQGGSWTNAMVTNNTVINPPSQILFDIAPVTPLLLPTGWTVDRNHYLLANASAAWFRVEGFIGWTFTQWKNNTGWDLNSTTTAPLPSTNLVVLQPNAYDTNRANLAIYNWSLSSNVAVSLSTLNWSTSDSVRVRNAQDYFSDVTTNSLPASVLTVPMLASSHTVALPNGWATPFGPMSFPTFGAFVIERIAGATPTPTNTITITSSPASGVTISATADLSGNSSGATTFARNYLFGSPITLIAPPTAGTNNFSKWTRAGVDFSNSTNVSFSVSTNETWNAVYVAPPVITWTLNMASSNPASGVAITNSPNDNGGLGQGTTAFSRTYNDGVSVTIAAALTAGGNDFQKWQRGGVDYTTSRSFSIVANSGNLLVNPQTFTAFYVAPAPPARDLVVNSIFPNSGVPIVVTVTDTNGNANGTTSFTRTYPQGAVLTLRAPPVEPGGNVFVDWLDNTGASASSGSTNVSVTMSTSLTRIAVYTNAPLPEINLSGAQSRRRGARP